jgi:hypothetical protein
MTARAKAFPSVWNFDKFGPYLPNKHLEQWITTDVTSPTWVISLQLLALRLFGQRTAPGQKRLLRWNTAGKMSVPTGSPLAKPRHQNNFISSLCICGALIGCGRSEDQTAAGVTDKVHICAKQPRMFLHKNTNCTAAIAQPLQNVRHSHLLSLNVDGKYNSWACVFWNISQTQAAMCG